MASSVIALNIDTSRLTQLAENSSRRDWSDLLRSLSLGECSLVICMSRIMELGRLEARRKANLVAFLRDVPTLLGQPEEVLELDELKFACAVATGTERRPPKPFALETSDWGYGHNAPGMTAADVLAISDSSLSEFAQLRAIADAHVETAHRLREQSAIVRDRLVALRAALEHHLSDQRLRCPSYGRSLSADELIDMAGGLHGFPVFEVKAQLFAARMAERTPAESNDVFDEDIARYHPYSAVSVLDRATVNRFWRARISGHKRVVSDLRKTMAVVRLVQQGELGVRAFYLPTLRVSA